MLTNASGGANRLALSGLKRAVPREVKARAVVMGLLFALILSAILVFQFLPTDQVILDVGDVSPRDIHAPYKKTYVSQVLTEREKAKAEAEVRDVYDPPDPRVARQQVAKARQICDYINSVRHDIYATPEQKYHWIQSIPDLTLPPTVISRTLDLMDEDWQEVADQTVYVLNQAMRRVIQENQLTEAKRTLPTSVSLDLSEEQAEIVIELVKNLIRPNSFYNADKTAEAKGRAGEGALQITQSVEKGESILRQGDIVTALDLEALDQFGLRQTSIKWFDIVGKVLFVLTIALVMGLYLLRFRPDFWISLCYQLLLSSLIMLFVLVAKMMVSGHALLPYLFPLATLSMLLSVLFDPQLAVLVTVLLSATVGLISDGSLEMTAYALFGGIIAALRLGRRVERLNVLLWCGTYVALANLAVIFTFRLPDQSNMIDLLPLIGIGIVNGGLSASLTLAGFSLLSHFFGITTSIQLLELARPDHPLLHQLLLKAPGTYHHSILVSNMAEQAAERIGADDLLARVGAYYHDIGKILRPYFFVDNQVEGVNVHDRLDPQTSAQIIISHVKDGLGLAKKYRLPRQIQDFISQHHGTGLASYFYNQAYQESQNPETVDEASFQYPGPKPQTKETAIVMLADSCEAAVRSARPTSPEEIDRLVRKIINDKLLQGELDECDLTMQDLNEIRASFVNILQGVFHPRVKYPEELTPAEKKVKEGTRVPTKAPPAAPAQPSLAQKKAAEGPRAPTAAPPVAPAQPPPPQKKAGEGARAPTTASPAAPAQPSPPQKKAEQGTRVPTTAPPAAPVQSPPPEKKAGEGTRAPTTAPPAAPAQPPPPQKKAGEGTRAPTTAPPAAPAQPPPPQKKAGEGTRAPTTAPPAAPAQPPPPQKKAGEGTRVPTTAPPAAPVQPSPPQKKAGEGTRAPTTALPAAPVQPSPAQKKAGEGTRAPTTASPAAPVQPSPPQKKAGEQTRAPIRPPPAPVQPSPSEKKAEEQDRAPITHREGVPPSSG